MDVHSTTTDLTVLNSKGKEILYRRISSRELDLIDFFKSIQGEKRAALEESQMADWVARVIEPYVSELIRCLPQHNRLITSSENKCDSEDSRNLADLLYMNKLKSVHHPDGVYRALREGVRAYWNASQQLTRDKNRLKAFFLFNGIHCEAERVYARRYRKEYYGELGNRGANVALAQILYLQTDSTTERKAMHLRLLRQVAKPVQDSIRRLMTIPGVGEIGGCTIAAYLENGWRLPNKRKLWQYGGIGIRRHTSNNRGYEAASLNGNRYLKNVFMTAAMWNITSGKDGSGLRKLYERDQAAGADPKKARRSLARKIAVIAQHLLRYQEEYDDEQLTVIMAH